MLFLNGRAVRVEGHVEVEFVCPFCGGRDRFNLWDVQVMYECPQCCKVFVVWVKPVAEAGGGYVEPGESAGGD